MLNTSQSLSIFAIFSCLDKVWSVHQRWSTNNTNSQRFFFVSRMSATVYHGSLVCPHLREPGHQILYHRCPACSSTCHFGSLCDPSGPLCLAEMCARLCRCLLVWHHRKWDSSSVSHVSHGRQLRRPMFSCPV